MTAPQALAAALADRYTIEPELGSGGMATVYLAEDLKHHRQVAIKILRPELAASLGVERFVREIEIAAKLTHAARCGCRLFLFAGTSHSSRVRRRLIA